jgi:hypothetical protein
MGDICNYDTKQTEAKLVSWINMVSEEVKKHSQSKHDGTERAQN